MAGFLDESRAYIVAWTTPFGTSFEDRDENTLAELTDCLGPVLGDWPDPATQFLCYPLLSLLERLERRQSATRIREAGKKVAWRPVGWARHARSRGRRCGSIDPRPISNVPRPAAPSCCWPWVSTTAGDGSTAS
ncbi:MAG: hypothetical protein R3C32_02600 [Chloroflexota bacterium]